MTAETLTVAAFSDVHYADEEDLRDALPRLKHCVAACNRLNPDLVVQLGDLIDHGMDNFSAPLAVLGGLHPRLLHVLGNHDFDVGSDRIGTVPDRFGLRRRFYEVAANGWRILVLDGNQLSTYANAEHSANFHLAEELRQELEQHDCTNAESWNGGVGAGQLSWLRSQLEAATRIGEPVAVFCHFPVYPASKYSLLNADELLGVLTAYSCVKLYANGHAHTWSDGMHQGIRFVTVPAMVENEPPGPLTLFRLSEAAVDIERVALD